MTTFYITTPIYYVNDVPHIGHAYTTIVADTLARYHRCRGHDVRYLTGTDEHGQKIEAAAQARGLQPKELADQVVSRFQQTWTHLDISNDDFIRTTEPRHREVVQALWRRMAANDDIYLGEYDGPYCIACEEYYTEMQLIEGRCPVHGTEVEQLKQASYFFRMSKYQQPLLDHFEKHPEFVRPEIRRNEIVSFIKGGLRDLSVSRNTLRWGLRVPGDDSHVVYVWVDALTNYISALGPFDDAPLYRQFWPVNVHLIGKDILRFHAVYWPCMLLSAGLPLPRCVFAHGWWTVNGEKMSKTLMNVVEPNMIAGDVGRDALRYFLLRETPLGNDGDFSHRGLIQRINADLANDLGNLVSRALAMAHKYCGGKMPPRLEDAQAQDVDRDFVQLAARVRDEVGKQFENLAPSRALETLWELVRGTNKYIDTTAPYRLARDQANQQRVDEVVANFLEALHWISLLVAPAMPDKALAIRKQLGLGEADPSGQLTRWPQRWGELPEGLQLTRGKALFPRIDDEQRKAMIDKWTGVTPSEASPGVGEAGNKQPPLASKPQAPTLSMDEFARLDLRIAQVESAERVEGTDRLLKITLDLGEAGKRQVVSGIADVYEPRALVGKQVVLVANLEPAKIRGVRSEGMILAAGDKRVLALAMPDQPVPPGSKVR